MATLTYPATIQSTASPVYRTAPISALTFKPPLSLNTMYAGVGVYVNLSGGSGGSGGSSTPKYYWS